ncbi:hypothetical protein Pla52o_43270 [Novipirellula galeiformis]|uniref:Uncharacterized protein n=1 Tax=Novipirellula galeiformis TaxID=2528004 RepID=A0A5C6CC88_9BACT|nr:hypothetical protein Pla52o_43270 [Novipirellula galeiformis]
MDSVGRPQTAFRYWLALLSVSLSDLSISDAEEDDAEED